MKYFCLCMIASKSSQTLLLATKNLKKNNWRAYFLEKALPTWMNFTLEADDTFLHGQGGLTFNLHIYGPNLSKLEVAELFSVLKVLVQSQKKMLVSLPLEDNLSFSFDCSWYGQCLGDTLTSVTSIKTKINIVFFQFFCDHVLICMYYFYCDCLPCIGYTLFLLKCVILHTHFLILLNVITHIYVFFVFVLQRFSYCTV